MGDKVFIAKTIGGVAEVIGHELSAAALEVMVRELDRYPETHVIGALHRCARECKYKLTLADILERLDDGRLGPEEAWAAIPRDEEATIVWTDEMATAWGAARPLLDEGDSIAARMAFLEVYRREVSKARADSKPCRWWPSLGHDQAGREVALTEAVRLGRLSADHVSELLPHLCDDPQFMQLAQDVAKKLVKTE